FSFDFPTFPGTFDVPVAPVALDGIQPDHRDIFVTKLDASGGALVSSTVFGGSSEESVGGIALDIAGAIYVAGATGSSASPPAPGVLALSSNGGDAPPLVLGDGFVTKLDPSGHALVYSTFLGGSNVDGVNAIAVDHVGAAYVVGGTASHDFPTTPGSFN